METNHRRLAVVFVLSGLAACGGSGGGGGGSSAPSNLTYSESDALRLSGVDAEPLLPSFDGDIDTFEVTPALPAGLVLDPLTGVVAGTPTAPAPFAVHTITARRGTAATSADVGIQVVAPHRLAVVTDATYGSIATLSVDTQAERLLRGPLAFAAPQDAGAERAAVHPNGRFVYIPYATSNTLAFSRVDEASGALDRVSSVPLGAGPHTAVVDPSGRWLLVASESDDQVQIFALDATSGAPTLTSDAGFGTRPSGLCFAPDGSRLYMTHRGEDVTGLGSSLVCCTFDASTGVANVQSTLALNGGRPTGLAIDARHQFVYLTLSMFDAVLVVRANANGSLTPIAPLRGAGDDPTDLAVDARGRYLFVSSSIDDEIRAFRVGPASGALTEVGDFEAGDDPRAIHCDPTGERLFALARGSSELITYRIGNAGDLTRESSAALRVGSEQLAFCSGAAPVEWTPGFVHCANSGSDDVHSFRIDATTGLLTYTGQAFTDDEPTSLAVDPRMRVAVVVAAGAHTVQSFRVAPTDGTLSPAAPSLAVAGTPNHACIAASGRFAYVTARDVATADDGWLSTYAIDATSGALTLVDSRIAGFGSCAVAVEPTGDYLYVANRGNGTFGSASISAFRVDPQTGIPTAVGTPVFAPGIVDLAFHPDGRSVYAVLRGSDALARYSIDRTSGGLLVVPPIAGPGLEPAALAVDPRGRFAWASYTGNAASGEIDVLPILANGDLDDVQQQLIDGEYPVSLSVEGSGRFLFAANQLSHDISVLVVDPTTGLLEARTPMLSGVTPTSLVASGTMH